jgi:hypothetical protein
MYGDAGGGTFPRRPPAPPSIALAIQTSSSLMRFRRAMVLYVPMRLRDTGGNQPDSSGAGPLPWDRNGTPSHAKNNGYGTGHDDDSGGGVGINLQHKSQKQIREEERAF